MSKPDKRADIYALGATIFQALSGRPAFPGPTMWDLKLQKLEHKVQFEAHLSQESVELLQAMMAPEPKDRIATYEVLIARIEKLKVMTELETGMRKIERPPIWWNAARQFRQRWRSIAAASLLVVIGAGLALRGETFSNGRYDVSLGEYQPDGNRIYLFEQSMSNWSIASGRWTKEQDNDGAIVLAGSGLIRKDYQADTEFQITIGLDLYKAKAAEVPKFISPYRPPHPKKGAD